MLEYTFSLNKKQALIFLQFDKKVFWLNVSVEIYAESLFFSVAWFQKENKIQKSFEYW